MKWSRLKFFQHPPLTREHVFQNYVFGDPSPAEKVLNSIEKQNYVPVRKDVFKAFELTPYDQTRVIILGQDPYPNKYHAMGLAFSVPHTTKLIPSSLSNIFKELVDDTGCPYPKHGDLTNWARQGVLLLNTSLTVIEGKPGSHSDIGWDELTKEVIDILNDRNVVYVLWGKQAQNYLPHIHNKDRVIMSAHPSGLSAYRGFIGSRCFSRINEIIDGPKINWEI